MNNKASSLAVLQVVEDRRSAILSRLKTFKYNNETLKSRIYTYMDLAAEETLLMKQQVSRVEQLKGIVGGIKLCVPLISQHKEIWKKKLADKDKQEFKQVIDIIGGCAHSIADMAQRQREDLLKAAGKLDFTSNSILRIYDRVDKAIDHYESQLEKEQEDDIDERLAEGRKQRAKAMAEKIETSFVVPLAKQEQPTTPLKKKTKNELDSLKIKKKKDKK